MKSLLIEEWRPVPSEPLLEASTEGRVRSVPYQTPMPYGGFKTNQLNPNFGVLHTESANYRRMQIVFRSKNYKVAALVAEAFIGPRPEGFDVSHEDENSLNNRPNNLLYRTHKSNLNMPKIKEYHRQACQWKMAA